MPVPLRPFLVAHFALYEDLLHRQETGEIGIHQAHVELNKLTADMRDDIGVVFAFAQGVLDRKLPVGSTRR